MKAEARSYAAWRTWLLLPHQTRPDQAPTKPKGRGPRLARGHRPPPAPPPPPRSDALRAGKSRRIQLPQCARAILRASLCRHSEERRTCDLCLSSPAWRQTSEENRGSSFLRMTGYGPPGHPARWNKRHDWHRILRTLFLLREAYPSEAAVEELAVAGGFGRSTALSLFSAPLGSLPFLVVSLQVSPWQLPGAGSAASPRCASESGDTRRDARGLFGGRIQRYRERTSRAGCKAPGSSGSSGSVRLANR